MGGKRKKKQDVPEKLADDMNEASADKTVDEILQEMPDRNATAYRFYCKVLGNRTSGMIGNHANFVAPNLQANLAPSNVLNLSTICQSFPYSSTKPIPLQTIATDSDDDPVMEIMLAKRKWKNDIYIYRTQGAMRIPKMVKYDENIIKISQHYINMGNVLQQDPDPNFDSEFNWYYCGNGNMLTIFIGSAQFLIHSVKSNLYATPFIKDILDFKKSATLQLPHGNILETISNNQQQNTLLALRSRDHIYIVAIQIADDSKVEMKLLKTYTSAVPVTNIEFNSHTCEVLNVAYLDGNIHLVNINTGENTKCSVNRSKSPKITDNWSNLKNYDVNHLFYLSKRSLNLIDTREFSNKASITFNKLSDGCNLLTSLQRSSTLDYGFYVGTTHNIFAVDVRSAHSHKIVQKWTHGMESTPILLSTCKYEGDELIFCNSQWIPDVCFLINPVSRSTEAQSTYIPWRAPNILHSLEEVQLKGYCIDPLVPYLESLSKSTTGAVIRTLGECVQALTLNSVGMISEQVLSSNLLSDENDRDFPILFTEKCSLIKSRKTNKPFEVSDCVDVRHIFNYCSSNVISESEVETPNNSHENKYNEKDALDLNTYKNFDIDLLGAWNLFDDINDSKPNHEK